MKEEEPREARKTEPMSGKVIDDETNDAIKIC